MKQNYLKRALLTAAAAALLTTSAGAAWTDFPDADAIVNREAVDALTARGILSGRGDGSFAPREAFRRDEMARLLSALLDPSAAESGQYDNAGGELSDISGSWAEGYIRHCYAVGVVSGKSGGRFDPAGAVTGTEAAVMLLGASGTDTAAFSGPDWASKANAAAVQAGLYEGFKADPAEPLCRDDAALLLYNALPVLGIDLEAPAVIDLRAFGVLPQGLALGDDGAIVLTDSAYRALLIGEDADGLTILAGGHGRGYVDGDAEDSALESPWGVAPFLDGWAVSDSENGAVRLVEGGEVRTLNALTSSGGKMKLEYPSGLAAGEDGCLYIADAHAGKVWRVSEDGKASIAAQNLKEPMGLCFAGDALYITEVGAHRVSVLEDGRVRVLAGSGQEGFVNGPASSAAFSIPQGVAVDGDGTVYVSDTGNSAVRRIRNGTVDTLYACPPEQLAPVSPRGMLIANHSLFVADGFSGVIAVFPL